MQEGRLFNFTSTLPELEIIQECRLREVGIGETHPEAVLGQLLVGKEEVEMVEKPGMVEQEVDSRIEVA